MSFDIQWETVCTDLKLALQFREFLNSKLSAVSLPHYLANLQVVDFNFGETAPEITIRDIDVPFDEFYESVDTESGAEESCERDETTNEQGQGLGDDEEDEDGDECIVVEERNRGAGEARKREDECDGPAGKIGDERHKREEEEAKEEAAAEETKTDGEAQDEEQEQGEDEEDDKGEDGDDNRQGERIKTRTKKKKKRRPTEPVESVAMNSRMTSPFFHTKGAADSNPRPASPHPFISGPNSLLMPRTSSGFVPTLGHSGVGLGGFGLAGGGAGMGDRNPSNNSSTSNMDSENDYFQHSGNDSSNDEGRFFNRLLDSIPGTENSEGVLHSPLLDGPDEPASSAAGSTRDKGLDVQLSVDINWDSQLYIELTCDLLVNYPAPEFIRLPVRLKVTDLKIHSLMVVAYISQKVFVSFLCDIGNTDAVDHEHDGGDAADTHPNESRQNSRKSNTAKHTKGKDRIDILQDMKIEGEIGNLTEWNADACSSSPDSASPPGAAAAAAATTTAASQATPAHGQHGPPPHHLIGASLNGPTAASNLSSFSGSDDPNDNNGLVLRNIGKIEKFLIGTFRALIIEELGWPGWIELDFNETEETDDEDDGSGEETEVVDGRVQPASREASGRELPAQQENEARPKANAAGGVSLHGHSTDRTYPRPRETGKAADTRRAPSRPASSVYSRSSRRPGSLTEESSVYSNDSYFTSDDEAG